MSKFTDAVVTTLQGYFNAGDQPTEAQFASLIDAIQEGIEEHDHAGTGDGDGVNNLVGPVGVGVAPFGWQVEIREADNAITGTDVDVSELALMLNRYSDTQPAAIGLGFGASSVAGKGTGAAIIFERIGSYGQGKLHFATKASVTDDATIPIGVTIDEDGNVGIGTLTPTSPLHVGLPVYANNAAAIAGGRTAGAFYRTNSDPDSVCVVH